MAGITLAFDGRLALQAIRAGVEALGDPAPLLQDIGELLLIIHRRRFREQIRPDGTPWKALSPGYLKRKSKNRDKILTLDGHLRNLLRYQLEGGDLLFGSDRPYAAIHHLGGKIERQARNGAVYFRQNARTGEVGRHFVNKDKSNQDVKIGPYVIEIPARPWLGISDQDDESILNRVERFVQHSMAGQA
ncbi:phage virion morphogenesis protein [compost metagenome]